jgi:hypothetical protein
MEGVSPIIAVVILIGLAVAVGITLSSWVTHMVQQQTGESSFCKLNTNYIISSAGFNRSGANELTMKITNKGTFSLYGFGVEVDNGTMVAQFNSTNSRLSSSPPTSSSGKLRQEQSVYLTLNMSGYDNLGRTAAEIKIVNDACAGTSASTNSIIQY